MTKIVPLHDDDLIFLDVIPELHPDFTERIRQQKKNKKQ